MSCREKMLHETIYGLDGQIKWGPYLTDNDSHYPTWQTYYYNGVSGSAFGNYPDAWVLFDDFYAPTTYGNRHNGNWFFQNQFPWSIENTHFIDIYTPVNGNLKLTGYSIKASTDSIYDYTFTPTSWTIYYLTTDTYDPVYVNPGGGPSWYYADIVNSVGWSSNGEVKSFSFDPGVETRGLRFFFSRNSYYPPDPGDRDLCVLSGINVYYTERDNLCP